MTCMFRPVGVQWSDKPRVVARFFQPFCAFEFASAFAEIVHCDSAAAAAAPAPAASVPGPAASRAWTSMLVLLVRSCVHCCLVCCCPDCCCLVCCCCCHTSYNCPRGTGKGRGGFHLLRSALSAALLRANASRPPTWCHSSATVALLRRTCCDSCLQWCDGIIETSRKAAEPIEVRRVVGRLACKLLTKCSQTA